jgi:hypothetical protein
MIVRNSFIEVDGIEEPELVKHPDDGFWTLRYDAAPNEEKIVEVSDDVRNPMWERDCPLCGTHLYKAVAATPIACHCGGFIWR